jgi:hypothetical protein
VTGVVFESPLSSAALSVSFDVAPGPGHFNVLVPLVGIENDIQGTVRLYPKRFLHRRLSALCHADAVQIILFCMAKSLEGKLARKQWRTKSRPTVLGVTPTPSETAFEFVFTPVGTFSVFAFKTPIPYPFGSERTGYLVTTFDAAVRSAKAHNAGVIVAPFDDPIGRDAIIEWPGGLRMQLYWHTTAPNYARLQTIPENRVYLSAGRADEFVRDFAAFSQGTVTSDDGHAPGVEIGRPGDTYRRVRIDSTFGTMAVLVTDGHLPYPYGREITGYEVSNLSETLSKAKAAGAVVIVEPYIAGQRYAAMIEFPGG